MTTPSTACSFCGQFPHEVPLMIAGDGASICSNCVKVCLDVLIARAAPVVPIGQAGKPAAQEDVE